MVAIHHHRSGNPVRDLRIPDPHQLRDAGPEPPDHPESRDLYPRYADSLRKQRRYAKEHGGERASDDDGHSREPEDAQPHEPGKTAPSGPASGSA